MHRFTFILGAAIMACCTMAGVSAAQQQTLDEAKVRLRDFNAQSRKGEFETTQEFEARRARIQQQIVALLREEYPATFNVRFETYDADTQILPVFGPMGPLKLVVPPSDARWIKEQSSARGSGTFWLEEDGSTFLIDRLTIKVGTRTFRTEPAATLVQRLPAHLLAPGGIYGTAAFSADGEYVADRGHLLEIVSGEQIEYSPRCKSVTFSNDGRFFACIYERDVTVYVSIYDLVNENWEKSWEIEARAGGPLAFSPDGALLALGLLRYERGRGYWNEILLWNVQNRQILRSILPDHLSRTLGVTFSRAL